MHPLTAIVRALHNPHTLELPIQARAKVRWLFQVSNPVPPATSRICEATPDVGLEERQDACQVAMDVKLDRLSEQSERRRRDGRRLKLR